MEKSKVSKYTSKLVQNELVAITASEYLIWEGRGGASRKLGGTTSYVKMDKTTIFHFRVGERVGRNIFDWVSAHSPPFTII